MDNKQIFYITSQEIIFLKGKVNIVRVKEEPGKASLRIAMTEHKSERRKGDSPIDLWERACRQRQQMVQIS